MRVLGLALYGSQAASTRYRLEQYIQPLAEKGIDLDVHSLLDNSYILKRYTDGSISLINLVGSVFKRVVFLLRHTRQYDVAIVHCELIPLMPSWLEKYLVNIPYIYDFDDAFFLKYRSGKGKSLNCFLGGKFDAMMRRAAGVSAGNAFLEHYASGMNKSTHVIPTVVDMDRYKIKSDTTADAPFTIGWIGSPSTSLYLPRLKNVLSVLAKTRSLRFVAVGGKAPIIEGVEVINLDWSEATEIDLIHSFDVGVMPLPNTEWAQGKCGFKLIQYMACGLPVIASPVGVNSAIVEPGVNGYCADTDEEWLIALTQLMNDSELRLRMGRAGRNKIYQYYSLHVTAPKLARLLTQVAEVETL